jgi:glutathionylspermidine synthase
MEDRIVDLSGIPDKTIKEHNLEFLLDDEYIVPEGIFVYQTEVDKYKRAHDEVYQIFKDELESIVRYGDFKFLGLPNQMVDLIVHSVEEKHMHLLGRFDFAGGINGLPIKLLEFNADMPTLLPESIIIQEGFDPITGGKHYCELMRRFEVAFNRLGAFQSSRGKNMLGTTFGHKEDRANIDIILNAAENEGFGTLYADLPNVEFARNEGVFVSNDNGDYFQFDYLLKLVPWEFICFEEPDLLGDLHNLILNDLIYLLNPAYTMVFQSKAFLVRIAEKYPSNYLLKTSHNSNTFTGVPYVQKANFGRLGENITIYDSRGNIKEHTPGDLDMNNCIYQEFALLYKDNCDEYYQPGIYSIIGSPAGLSFRRADKMIIDDDCQFIPHYVKA